MRATGIVRRIDDLGRVVIPMEIRRNQRISSNSPIEIFTDINNEIVLKKYSPVKELGAFAEDYALALNQSLEHIACIADRDEIIAVAGTEKKRLLQKQLNPEIMKLMEERKVLLQEQPVALTSDGGITYTSVITAPIIVEGDIVGAVILAANDPDKKMGQLEFKMVETAAGFLGKQIAT
ncbi:MAG: Stage V sporulation protein T [Pelotomaculum sp. PtaU1.Bin035]|nr:MAG: Stage V sporulation protein T [Pelotomaculum sp. PtaU1.Bin035]